MQRFARLLCIPFCLLISLYALAAQAATITVTTNADTGTGSLRAAIAAAASGDTINFASDMTITLTSGSTLAPVNDVTIDATGHNVAVDGNSASTVLTVLPGVTVQLTGLTIQNGNASGGNGGGIYNGGTVNLTNCTLSRNSALVGGGIFNNGTLTLINSTLLGNNGALYGGGILAYGSVTLANSTLAGNSSPDGGGIYNGGSLTLSNSTLSGNSAGRGGGIENLLDVILTSSTLSGNSADVNGGGIANEVGTVTLSNSTLSGNSATNGAGIFNDGGTATISDSALSSNSASVSGGGIYNAGTFTLTNSTLSSNNAPTGGGIFNSGVTMAVANSTLSGNSGGNPGSDIYVLSGNTILTNSIVDQGEGSNVPCSILNIFASITDNGGNLDSGTSCGFTASTSKSNATLNLGPLANNGGPTQTMLPGAGSAAIDAGIDAVCAAAPVNGLDQRGIPRPQGAHCDSGAVEVVAPQTLTVGVTGNGSVSAGASPAPQSGGILSCTNAGGANCSATYATGQSVVLTAVVPSGSNVTWGGACAAAGNSTTATVTMSAAENCTATFALNIATTALTSPSSTSTYGQPVTFIATMAITAASVNMLPTGTVTFLDGGTPIGTGTLTYVGVATFTTSGLSAGSHSITAQYGGDGNFLASAPQPVSNTLTFAVSQKSTTVSLVVAPDHVALGQSITITATVAGDPPTGTVTFTDNGITLPCSPATLVPGATSSTAVCTDTPTGTGSHTIIATYSGDGNYTGATSSAGLTVNADASAAPTLDRWAMAILTGLLCMSVALQLRGTNRHV